MSVLIKVLLNNPRGLKSVIRKNTQYFGRSIVGFFERLFLIGQGRKNFSGNIFDRMHGLECLLDDCEDTSVLDIGASEGLISYEFARRGASIIHGIELIRERTWIANRLFRDVPVQSKFICENLALGVSSLQRKHGDVLLDQYDIVLFLGVYHHLKKYLARKELLELILFLTEKSKKYFAIRSPDLQEVDNLIRSNGFEQYKFYPLIPNTVGQIRIYRRQPGKTDSK